MALPSRLSTIWRRSGVAAKEDRHLGLHEAGQFQAFVESPHGQEFATFFQGLLQVEIERFRDHFARFDFGEVENVADEVQKFLRAGSHTFGVFALGLVELRVEEQAGHADDAVHGSTDFVAHVRQELALGEVCHLRAQRHLVGPCNGLLELPVDVFQFLGGLFAVGHVQHDPDDALLPARGIGAERLVEFVVARARGAFDSSFVELGRLAFAHGLFLLVTGVERLLGNKLDEILETAPQDLRLAHFHHVARELDVAIAVAALGVLEVNRYGDGVEQRADELALMRHEAGLFALADVCLEREHEEEAGHQRQQERAEAVPSH
jgi:hypothetical protein